MSDLFRDAIVALKDQIQAATEFNKPWHYFFDHLGENPEFLRIGIETQSPFLEAALAEIGKSVFKAEASVSNLLMLEIEGQDFIHGGCLLQGRLTNFLFYKDINVGLVSVLMSLQTSEYLFIRFSGAEIKKGQSFVLQSQIGGAPS